MRKLNLIFQELLKILMWFLLFYVWLRYFTKKFWLSLLLSLLFGSLTYIAIKHFRQKKQHRIGLKLKEKTEAENIFLSLACQTRPIDFFVKLASKKHTNIEKHKEYLTILHPENVKTVLYFLPSFEGLNVTKFVEIYQKVKSEKATKIVICCKEANDKNLPMFLSNFQEKVLILDQYQSYEKLYKFYDCFPAITHKFSEQKKTTFKDFVAYSFNKQRTKGYLLSALLLILSSLFVGMTIYYCIVGSILIIFAIISQFNPTFNNSKSVEIL